MLLACPESGMMWPDANPSVVRRPDGDDLEQQAIAAYLAGRVADTARALQGPTSSMPGAATAGDPSGAVPRP
jgi:hypothetical protein